MNSADFIQGVGQLPGLRTLLRWYARQYREGSVVNIAHGVATGMRWRRHHRYVNGYWLGIYELPLQRAIAREVETGQVFYDVGANAGFFSVLAAQCVGPMGRVLTFEPLPENIESVQEQILLNKLTHCHLITKAVSDRKGSVSFVHTGCNSTAHMSSPADGGTRGSDQFVVETISLDEVVLSYPPPDFIKIDVEGAETEVLEGARNLLSSSRPPKLLIELHGYMKAVAVERTLSSFGYTLTDLAGVPLPHGASEEHHVLAFPPKE